MILVNCGLDKLSFFDKLGSQQFLDKFREAFCLKQFGGSGFLFRVYPENWSVFKVSGNGVTLIQDFGSRPKPLEVEQLIKRAV
mmetsp:Transcript_422/g.757  ORF Transcript_422/g.757 Transcript_422/m.757 type:complete len:83 (+) Transcript_422:2865-3113(+)